MIKEIVSQNLESTILHVQKTKIHSIQKKNLSKTGLRLYDQGRIGISGAIGNFQEEELEKKAKEMLAMDILYEPAPTKDLKHHLAFPKLIPGGVDFVMLMEDCLGKMEKAFPDFAFSHKIQLNDCRHTMKNDDNLDLQYEDHYLDLALLYKHAKSVELIDGHLSYSARSFNQEKFMSYCEEKLNAYENKVDLSEGYLPVIFSSDFMTLFLKFMQELNGRAIALKSSMLNDKMGLQYFHEDFSLYQSHDSQALFKPFYDSEGTCHPMSGYKVPLIDKGVIKQGYTDKRTALEYGLPHTGSAVSDFDGIPSLNYSDFHIQPGVKSLDEILNDRDGVYVDMAAGGDFTAQGDFATPVQASYLVRGGKLIGRLPPLQLNSKLEDMFGKDFVGVTKNPLFPVNPEHGIVINFMIKKM